MTVYEIFRNSVSINALISFLFVVLLYFALTVTEIGVIAQNSVFIIKNH